MHRFPANPSSMAAHPPQPTSAPFPSQDGPPPQPYPGYPPPPPHDARRSNSPYVNAQGIPLPPAPTDSATQQPAAQNTETTIVSGRPSRKRKLQSPTPEQSAQNTQAHQLPPPPPPPHYHDPTYYGQPHPPVDSQGNPVPLPPPGSSDPPQPPEPTSPIPQGGRQLSTSKRAEQNRKAQRAFRERRDAHVKALESRSQLLDAALASADEANRRWEECRALVDQLRVENAALRAALNQLQVQAGAGLPPAHSSLEKPVENGAAGPSREGSVEHDGGDE